MKRFHVHIAVDDIDKNINFYNKLFGQPPTKQHQDYAKWMLEDPRLNFAISSRGHSTGVNHLGMQADSPEELDNLKLLADDASEGAILVQGDSACCYARSEKHWTLDPQGLAWEHYLTLSDAEVFGEDVATQTNACCIPLRSTETSTSKEQGSCCIPGEVERLQLEGEYHSQTRTRTQNQNQCCE